MFRHLARAFHRSLQLNPLPSVVSSSIGVHNGRPLQQLIILRSFYRAEATSHSEVEENELDGDGIGLDVGQSLDSEYMPPYRIERESRMSTNALVEVLRTRFRLSPAEVERVMSDDVVHRAHRERCLLHALETLCMEGVTKRVFVDCPWLITLDKQRLDAKLTLLHYLSMRDINHFVPFLRLTVPRMRKLVALMNREKDSVPLGNRVYYVSDRLKSDPYTVAKYLSKRLFVLEMPFDMFEQNLQCMIEYKVNSKDVLRDLWAFRYTPRSVQLRLERARRAKKDKIMPWMVRCPEPILQRSLKLAMDESAVLGEMTNNIEYVAERLGFQPHEAKAIMTKHPQVLRVRVPKIKEVLDYLLDEAGFTRFEVAQVPRILCHSLETTKARLEELKSIGCRPTSLVIICRSKREYAKFVKAWSESKRPYPSEGAPNRQLDPTRGDQTVEEKT